MNLLITSKCNINKKLICDIRLHQQKMNKAVLLCLVALLVNSSFTQSGILGLIPASATVLVNNIDTPPATSGEVDGDDIGVESSQAPLIGSFKISTTSATTNANNAWNAMNRIGGGCCDGCKTLKYISLKKWNSNRYFHAHTSYINQHPVSITAGPPNQSYLWEMKQNFDCSWSFKANNGRHLSANPSGSWWNVIRNGSIGCWERFSLVRSKGWIYIRSVCNSSRYLTYTTNGGFGKFQTNRASRLIMEIWP